MISAQRALLVNRRWPRLKAFTAPAGGASRTIDRGRRATGRQRHSAAILLPGERPYLNRVFENIGEVPPLADYIAWLNRPTDPRGSFKDCYARAIQSWNVAEFPDPASLPPLWLELIGHRIVRRLADRSLSRYAKPVCGLARPALRIVPKRSTDKALPVGCSKFGGHPDLHLQIDVEDLRQRAFDKIRLMWVDWD